MSRFTEDEEAEAEEEEEPPSEDDKAKRKRGGRGAATGGGRNAREVKVSKAGRPRRSTAGRGKADLSSYVEYSSSDEDEKFTKKQAIKRKRGNDDSDSGSDVSATKRVHKFNPILNSLCVSSLCVSVQSIRFRRRKEERTLCTWSSCRKSSQFATP